MKITTLLSMVSFSLASFATSIADEAKEDKPNPAVQETKGYSLFAPSLTKGECKYSGLITSAEDLVTFFKKNPNVDAKLVKFFEGIDFKTQSIFVYGYKHGGSGMDRPASKTDLKEGVLTVEIFDENTSPIRTMDYRESFHHVAIIVDKKSIKEIKVINKINPRKLKEENFPVGHIEKK